MPHREGYDELLNVWVMERFAKDAIRHTKAQQEEIVLVSGIDSDSKSMRIGARHDISKFGHHNM